jgi:hypothetical protein
LILNVDITPVLTPSLRVTETLNNPESEIVGLIVYMLEENVTNDGYVLVTETISESTSVVDGRV